MRRLLQLIVDDEHPSVEMIGESGAVTNEFHAVSLESAMGRLGAVLDTEARNR